MPVHKGFDENKVAKNNNINLPGITLMAYEDVDYIIQKEAKLLRGNARTTIENWKYLFSEREK